MTMDLSDLNAALADTGWLRRLSRGLVHGDMDAAADLVQEATVSLWQRPPVKAGPLRPWLARVLRNRSIDGHRQDERRRSREGVAHALGDAQVPSAEELMQRMEIQRRLTVAVAALAEPFRRTVVLHYFDGLSSAEIARREHTPEGTVRGRLKEGLDRLRNALDAEHEGRRGAWVVLLRPLWTPEHQGKLPRVKPVTPFAVGFKLALFSLAFVLTWGLANRLWQDDETHGQPGFMGESVPGGGQAAIPKANPLVPVSAVLPTLTPCQIRLASLRQVYDEFEQRLLNGGSLDGLHEFGSPNERAQIAISSAVQKNLAKAGLSPDAVTSDCRGRVCRMGVRIESPAAQAVVAGPPEDPELKKVVARWDTVSRAINFGSAEGIVESRATFWILWSHDVSPVPQESQRSEVQTVASRQLPVTDADCQAEIQYLESSVQRAPSLIERSTTMPSAFESASVDTALTAATVRVVQATTRRLWRRDDFAVLCRGLVCRLETPEGWALQNRGWLTTLIKTPELAAERIQSSSVDASGVGFLNGRTWIQGKLTVRRMSMLGFRGC